MYDAVYGSKKYDDEAAELETIIAANSVSRGNMLLDVACGTGKHLQYLAEKFSVTGFDIENSQIERARERVPTGLFFQDDMRTFQSDKKYDAILCMFSSIAYMHDKNDFEMALVNFINHLKPGGCLIVEPWVRKKDWKGDDAGLVKRHTLSNGKVIERRVEKHANNEASTLIMHFIITNHDGTVERYTESHVMNFCRPEDYEHIAVQYHMTYEWVKSPLFERQLFVATNPI